MLDTYVIYVDLPPTVKGMIVKTFDENGGDDCYTVVINSRLNYEQQLEAYRHELRHIQARDFEQADLTADEIEMVRHYK